MDRSLFRFVYLQAHVRANTAINCETWVPGNSIRTFPIAVGSQISLHLLEVLRIDLVLLHGILDHVPSIGSEVIDLRVSGQEQVLS